MINLLCFAFTFLATVNSQGAKCQIDFMQFGESCYHIFATPKLTWWDAMSFCGMYGFGEGTLATVESAEEQLFLERELKTKYLQTHHPFPGKPYKGGTFTGYLRSDPEGELLCSMLKAAFRRGVMFNLGKKRKVVLDGFSLYDGEVYNYRYWVTTHAYNEYIQTLKAELAVKGITAASLDQTRNLKETFIVVYR